MRILSIEEVDLRNARRIFRSNTWLGLLAATTIMLGVTAFVALPKGDNFGWVFVVAPALLTLMFLLITLHHLRICMKSGNWLLMETDDGLFINLRSFRDHALPSESHYALFIPTAQVAAVGKTIEHRTLPHHWMREKSQFAYIDLYLGEGVELDALQRILREERRRVVTAIPDCPVRVPEAGVVRLVWDWIHPREDKALLLLGENYAVAPLRTIRSPKWENLPAREKDALIDQLWEWGQQERAYMLASQHHGIREQKVRAIVDERCRAVEAKNEE